MNQALNPARSVSVSASAGSGKTWLLTARITRLLLEGHEPNGILALTFTRKAAAEMRHRVEERLRQLALADDAALDALLAELDLQANDAIRQRARSLYEQLLFHPWPLRATTLHAFCQDLVARFPQEVGIAPGFEVSENEQALLEAAWSGLQKKLLAAPQSAPGLALKKLIDEGETEWSLRNIVVQFLSRRAEWWSYTDGQDDALEFSISHLREQLEIVSEDPYTALQVPSFEQSLGDFSRGLGAVGKIGQYVRADELLPALEQSGEQRYQTLIGGLFTQKLTPYGFKPSQVALKTLGSSADRFIQAHGEVVTVMQRIIDQLARLYTLRRTESALILGTAALSELKDEFRVRNRIGFTDLEWYASKLLRDPDAGNWVQFKLDQRIDHLLLDEFQDTSPTQWQLLLPLLEEMAAGNSERARSLFIVGDIKQSIYGFRRANPDLLPQAAAWMQEHLDAHQETLSLSRRSSPAIINWVNALFSPGLIPNFPVHGTARSGWGRVELAPLIAPDIKDGDEPEPFRNPLTTPRPDPENTRALREGHLIAERIRKLVDARWEIEGRALSYGDVLILTRKRTHLRALEQALTEAEIPFIGAARGTLLKTAEAADLAALLRFLLSPVRDLELAHVLRSPMFSASNDDLIELVSTARKNEQRWRAALQQATTSVALQRAQTLLEHWLKLSRQLPVHDLLDRIYNEGDLAARYEAALPAAQGVRVRGNLNALLQMALETDSGRYPSLSRFLQELTQLERSSEAPDETPPHAASNQVRILTVHGAKGLEAPAVFMAQTGNGNSSNKDAGWVVEWPSSEARPTCFVLAANKDDRDSFSQSLIDARKQRETAEDMNLLYVAVTRARQFLHLSGFSPSKPDKETSWHEHATNAFMQLGANIGDDDSYIFVDGMPAIATDGATDTAQVIDDPRLRQPIKLSISKAQRPSASGEEHDSAAILRGHAVHYLLLQLSESDADVNTALRGRLEAAIGSTVRDADFASWLAEAQAVIAAPALQPFFNSSKIQRAWNEVPISHGELHGVIDRLVDDGETLWLLDYKTARGGDDEALLARYREQLLAYREGLSRLWPGRPVRMGLLLTHAMRWLELN
ncbi:MAG: UvrD-helicase domain-containing protein [Pseudomonadota bacterium]